MKYVRFNMSNGNPISVPAKQALDILKSPNKIDLVSDENGNWTGETINKAHIVSTEEDRDRLREEGERLRLDGKSMEPTPPIQIIKKHTYDK